jgi:hypothetical protein
METLSRNHCCMENQRVLHILSVCVCVCVCVCSLSYSGRKAHVPYYIVICGPSGSTIFYHIIS